jgi:hypothetical protein
VEVREASGIDQADISRLEGRESPDESQVSTLQRYIAALGGRLDVVAVFGDKKIILTGVRKVPEESRASAALPRTRRRLPRR